MKVAVSGKGGSGKTTVSGTIARVFAQQGYDVLAIDDDEDPNLPVTIGIPREQEVEPLPGDLVKRVQPPDGDAYMEVVRPSQEIINDYGVEAPDGIRLLKIGEVEHAGSGCMCSAHAVSREVLSDIVGGRDEVTVVDMVAGVEHLKRGTAKDVDTLLVVVEPYYKSLETGRRTKELATDLGIPDVRVVANKVRGDKDHTAIDEFCTDNDLEIAAVVPYDDAIRHADQNGVAPIDYNTDSEAVQAIRMLADELVGIYA